MEVCQKVNYSRSMISLTIARVRQAKWALRVTFFFMGMSVAATSARLAEIKHNTGGSQTAFGTALMLGNIGTMVGNLIGHRLSNSFGTRTVTRIALAGVAVSQISYGFINQLWQVPFVAFLAGASYALANVGANSQGSMIQENAGRSLMPSFHGSWSIGALFASFTAGIVAKHFSPAQHLLVNSLIALIGAWVINRALLPKEVDRLDQKSNSEIKHDEALPPVIKRFLLLVSVGSMLSVIAEASVGDWSTILLHEDFHISLGMNTYGYTAFILAQTTSRFTVGKMIDKFGIPTVIRYFGVIGGIGYFIGLVIANDLHLTSPHAALAVMCISYAILGFGIAPMPPSFVSIAGSIPGMPTARAVARMQLISAVGFFIGRGVVSFLAGAIGLPLALLFPAIALIGSGLLSNALKLEKLSK
jgi:MFS family permease